MLVSDQPVAADFAIAVGDANRHVERLTVRVGSGDALDAVTEAEAAVGRDAQVRELEFQRTLEKPEESLPVLAIGIGSDILPGRHDVEDDKAFAGT